MAKQRTIRLEAFASFDRHNAAVAVLACTFMPYWLIILVLLSLLGAALKIRKQKFPEWPLGIILSAIILYGAWKVYVPVQDCQHDILCSMYWGETPIQWVEMAIACVAISLVIKTWDFVGKQRRDLEREDRIGELRRRAEQGDAESQAVLGSTYFGAYYDGKAVRQDYAEASKWYRKAAEQGHAFAQFTLGCMHSDGQGTPRDDAEAVKWWRRAAEQGNADGQFNVGYAYANGKGVPQDQAEAVKWYRKSADQGDADAQVEVAIAYYEGRGVRRNSVQSYKWLTLASSKPWSVDRDIDPPTIEEVASKMTPQQIARAQRLAKEWKPSDSA